MLLLLLLAVALIGIALTLALRAALGGVGRKQRGAGAGGLLRVRRRTGRRKREPNALQTSEIATEIGARLIDRLQTRAGPRAAPAAQLGRLLPNDRRAVPRLPRSVDRRASAGRCFFLFILGGSVGVVGILFTVIAGGHRLGPPEVAGRASSAQAHRADRLRGARARRPPRDDDRGRHRLRERAAALQPARARPARLRAAAHPRRAVDGADDERGAEEHARAHEPERLDARVRPVDRPGRDDGRLDRARRFATSPSTCASGGARRRRSGRRRRRSSSSSR